MRTAAVFAVLGLASGLCSTWDTDPVACVRAYNVVWKQLLPELNSTWINTMPIGNGIVAANVWTDGASRLSLLLASQEAWNEASQMIKVGLVNITFPNPGVQAGFLQTMDVGAAAVNITLVTGVTLSVWIDIDTNNVIVDYSSLPGGAVPKIIVENLRPTVTEGYTGQYECLNYSISKDTVTTYNDTAAMFFHRNDPKQTYFANMVAGMNLGEATFHASPDKLANRTSGGLAVVLPAENRVIIAVHTSQASVEEYTAALERQVAVSPPKAAHDKWWASFWDRSHVETANATVNSQYVLHRYLQACQARSTIPIKFNGMLYTAIKPPMTDYRERGGRNWWQNARLPYYNMLANGDFDLLKGFLQGFNDTLPVARAITSHYYNFTTGAFWNEYSDALFGTAHVLKYGCGRAGATNPPYWWSEGNYNKYNQQGSLDLSLLILDHHSHTGDTSYLHIPAEVLEFYRQVFPNNDAAGKMHLFPTQGLETWQCPDWPVNASNCVTNDMATVAGLTVVTKGLLDISYGTPQQRAAWQQLQQRIPPVPMKNGTLQPCEVCPPTTENFENVELYAVHPYRMYTVGRSKVPGVQLDPAIKAFDTKWFQSDRGWNQNLMDAALLGNASAAKAYLVARAGYPSADGYRFPAFMPHLQDYQPSADHLSVLMNGLNYMVVQEDDTPDHRLVLTPAWPCSWELSFKLHGPLNTVVTGSYQAGLLEYTVDPPERTPFVSAMPCQDA
eukprot:gene15320-23416_t